MARIAIDGLITAGVYNPAMIRIGVTGHRPHRLLVPERTLARRVDAVLRGLISACEPARGSAALEIISPLAEGCDRIVARAALALGQRVSAIIPFAPRTYERTFADAGAILEFRKLWRACHTRASIAGSLDRCEIAYVAVGMATLARADAVLTIWDGGPSQGRGGAPEMIENALLWHTPVIWIDAAADRAPKLLDGARLLGRGDRLERAKRSAKPLSRATYREIAARAGVSGE